MSGGPEDSPSSGITLLRVVRGDASPEEIAALVAVLTALGSGPAGSPPRAASSEWNSPHRLVRTPHVSGPDGWRSSSLPR